MNHRKISSKRPFTVENDSAINVNRSFSIILFIFYFLIHYFRTPIGYWSKNVKSRFTDLLCAFKLPLRLPPMDGRVAAIVEYLWTVQLTVEFCNCHLPLTPTTTPKLPVTFLDPLPTIPGPWWYTTIDVRTETQNAIEDTCPPRCPLLEGSIPGLINCWS